jgi:hypothetical protein
MDDGSFVEVIHGGHDAVLEFLFGCDPDVAQDRAGELGEKALDQVQPGAVLGREGKFEAARRSVGEPGFRLLGDVCRMIVEDQTDRRMIWIGGIDQLEKRDELAAAVAVLDQGMDLAGDKVDAGQHADRAVALVLKLAREARVNDLSARKDFDTAGALQWLRSRQLEQLGLSPLLLDELRSMLAVK